MARRAGTATLSPAGSVMRTMVARPCDNCRNKLDVGAAAAQIDPAVQGASYFYLAEHAFPVGTRTLAHMALEGRNTAGLLIPDSAIVWYGGQRWVYIRTAADRFTRRLVPAAFATDQGVIATSGFRAGDDVVMRGVQLLLSEEQRPQGIATQCKDPPECDD